MCGVFGFVGAEQSVSRTVGVALKALEYRGYDSWGIVWQDRGRLRTVKQVGRVPTTFTFEAVSRIAVGHTRWATHGGVTTANAHPHLDWTARVAIVHNGIIENAHELRQQVPGFVCFQSETDSEVIAHLLGQELEQGGTITDALRRVFPLLEGQNAVVAIDQQTELIAAAMNVSPLIVGCGGEGACIASDPFALVGRATSMIVAPRDAVIELSIGGIRALSFSGEALPLPDEHPVPDVSADELGSFDTFMAKEMSEQASVLRWQADDLPSVRQLADVMETRDSIVLTGCGSAYYAARLGASWIGRFAGRRALAVQASELPDFAHFLGPKSVMCAVTQSGETADVLDALSVGERSHAALTTLTNVVHSSAARYASTVVPLGAGRERSVLATKSMTAMLGRLLSTALTMAGEPRTAASQLRIAAEAITTLPDDSRFNKFIDGAADYIGSQQHVYVIGRGDAFGVAQEAALKIKEASYIHAEAFAAGELKHGAIALIENGSPCLLFTAGDRHARDTAVAAQEVRSRGGYTIGVGPGLDAAVDLPLVLDPTGPSLALIEIFVAQTLALVLATRLGLDPDFPRNLAKSVTVK